MQKSRWSLIDARSSLGVFSDGERRTTIDQHEILRVAQTFFSRDTAK
jgi:hypothetical protein